MTAQIVERLMWSPSEVASVMGVTVASVRERCREGEKCRLDAGACGATHIHAKHWGASWPFPNLARCVCGCFGFEHAVRWDGDEFKGTRCVKGDHGGHKFAIAQAVEA